jgi:hypothetical protein
MYSNLKPPKKYKCSKCGAHGCKLWREYSVYSRAPLLFCAPCGINDQERTKGKITPDMIRPDGSHEIIEYDWGKGQIGDSFGWLVPAIPDEAGLGFWGYTSVPNDGIAWWKALPSLPTGVAA